MADTNGKAAGIGELNDLHAAFAGYLRDILMKAMDTKAEDWMPLDAATMGIIVKFLKDNAVTADPADNATISGLRAKFAEARQAQTPLAGIIKAAEQDQEHLH